MAVKEEYVNWHKERFLKLFKDSIDDARMVYEEYHREVITNLQHNPSKKEGLTQAIRELARSLKVDGYTFKHKQFGDDGIEVEIFW